MAQNSDWFLCLALALQPPAATVDFVVRIPFQQSTASGGNSTVMAGFRSCAGGLYSVAAGNRAKIRLGSFSGEPGAACDGVPLAVSGFGDRNTFVWADSQDADYLSSGADQFNIRARGGVNLHDSTSLSFGSGTRQMLNLFSQNYGIGVQSSTLYFRTNSRFAWFSGGAHADTSLDPGSGGSLLMTLGTVAGTPTGTARAQTFTSVSDRNAKTALEPVDSLDVLARVLSLPASPRPHGAGLPRRLRAGRRRTLHRHGRRRRRGFGGDPGPARPFQCQAGGRRGAHRSAGSGSADLDQRDG